MIFNPPVLKRFTQWFTQTVKKKIVTKWITIYPTDYLFFDTFFQPLSSVKLNQRLNKLYDNKWISVNALRH